MKLTSVNSIQTDKRKAEEFKYRILATFISRNMVAIRKHLVDTFTFPMILHLSSWVSDSRKKASNGSEALLTSKMARVRLTRSLNELFKS